MLRKSRVKAYQKRSVKQAVPPLTKHPARAARLEPDDSLTRILLGEQVCAPGTLYRNSPDASSWDIACLHSQGLETSSSQASCAASCTGLGQPCDQKVKNAACVEADSTGSALASFDKKNGPAVAATLQERRRRSKNNPANDLLGGKRQVNAAALKNRAHKGAEARFQLQTLLGAGGMCEVFAALDLRRVEWGDTKPLVAVKRLLPEFSENSHAQLLLAQEFFTLRHIVHPGVVRVFDLHREPFGLCFSMELLEGYSIQDWMNRKDALESGQEQNNAQDSVFAAVHKQPKSISAKLFDTLGHLHCNGVVHADIKPANIFLAQEGRVVLFDFNVSLVESRPGSACADMAQGLRSALRLPAYSPLHAAPERLLGGSPSAEDDVFAACCTIYEMIQGEHPFKRLTSVEASAKGLSPDSVYNGSFSKGAAWEPGLESSDAARISAQQWRCLCQGLSFAPEQRPSALQLRDAFMTQGWRERLRAKLCFSI